MRPPTGSLGDFEVCRLRAAWKGDTLYALLPGGQWHRVASFVEGRFEVRQAGYRWALARVRDVGSRAIYCDLLTDQPVYDYSLLWQLRATPQFTLGRTGKPEPTPKDTAGPTFVLGEGKLSPDATGPPGRLQSRSMCPLNRSIRARAARCPGGSYTNFR
jgi:hypothetical protein